jgi:hypothetical protein
MVPMLTTTKTIYGELLGEENGVLSGIPKEDWFLDLSSRHNMKMEVFISFRRWELQDSIGVYDRPAFSMSTGRAQSLDHA